MSVIPRCYRTVFLALLLLLAVDTLSAQIEVVPTRVLLDMRERSREIKVINPTDNQMEIDADVGFKLIRTDSLGNMGLDSARTPEEFAKSCQAWLKVFPRRFVLPPRSSRSIRVMIMAPDGIDDGEYWGRLIVGSVPTRQGVRVDVETEGIQTQLTMRIELSMPVIYRKGRVETGIEVENVEVVSRGEETLALIDLKRLGNSAYRGTLTASLRNADGSDVASTSEQLTTEFTLRNAVRLPKLSNGTYTFELNLESTKKGSAADAVLPAEPVARLYSVAVDGGAIRIEPKQ